MPIPEVPGMGFKRKKLRKRSAKAVIESAEPFPVASGIVDGRRVLDDVPNTSSISASLLDYDVLPGVREVPLSAFETTNPHDLFYAVDDFDRTSRLADEIKASGEITPLIVVMDAEGIYVLEGAHRLGALHILKANSLPALIVIDNESLADGFN